MLRKEEVADWLETSQLDPSLAELGDPTVPRRPLETIRRVGDWLLRSLQYPCSNEAVVIWAHWHIHAVPRKLDSNDKA